MMDLKKFNVEELNNLRMEINKELEKRAKEDYQKAYKNVLSALEVMAKRYPFHEEFYFEEGATWDDVYDVIKRNFEGI